LGFLYRVTMKMRRSAAAVPLHAAPPPVTSAAVLCCTLASRARVQGHPLLHNQVNALTQLVSKYVFQPGVPTWRQGHPVAHNEVNDRLRQQMIITMCMSHSHSSISKALTRWGLCCG
jgi:hypothetical protein